MGAATREHEPGRTCRTGRKVARARSRTDRLFRPSAVYGPRRWRSPQPIVANDVTSIAAPGEFGLNASRPLSSKLRNVPLTEMLSCRLQGDRRHGRAFKAKISANQR